MKRSVLSPAFSAAIPKGRSSEEGIAGEKARSVEVVTASGEHEYPENRHARYPGGRHHCHATLPHVILCQHRDRKRSLFLTETSSTFMDLVYVHCVRIYCTCMSVRVFLSASVRVCLHTLRISQRTISRVVYFNDYRVPFLSEISERALQISNRACFDTMQSNVGVCNK